MWHKRPTGMRKSMECLEIISGLRRGGIVGCEVKYVSRGQITEVFAK